MFEGLHQGRILCATVAEDNLLLTGGRQHSKTVDHTVDREILVVKKFRWDPTTTKIKHTKIFQQRKISAFNFCRWAPLTKIKHDENLTDEILLTRKFLNLQHVMVLSLLSAPGRVLTL